MISFRFPSNGPIFTCTVSSSGERRMASAGVAGPGFRPTPEKRRDERFIYEYDFCDFWQLQIRIEGVEPIEESKIYPVCIGGANAPPIEDCGGPEAYMDRIEAHRLGPLLDTLEDFENAVDTILDPQGQGNVRDQLGSLLEILEELAAHESFRPKRFDRRRLNSRLRQYTQGDHRWRSQEVAHENQDPDHGRVGNGGNSVSPGGCGA